MGLLVLECHVLPLLKLFLAALQCLAELIFRMDWLDLLAVQGTPKSLLQHYSAKASILWWETWFDPWV